MFGIVILFILLILTIVFFFIIPIALHRKFLKEEKEKKEKEAEEARKRWEALSKAEKKRECKQASINASAFIYSLPKNCPSCHQLNFEGSSSGFASCKWILISTEIKTKERFDGATRVMGATTVHTNKYQEEIKTYKCPKCGYTIKK